MWQTNPNDTPLDPSTLYNKVLRQQHFKTSPAPSSRFDYLRAMNHIINHPENHSTLRTGLHFVPDSFTISPEQFHHYVNLCVPILDEKGYDDFLLSLLDDCNDILVPRWLQITLQLTNKNGNITDSFLIEDKQPRWNNPQLLSRIPTIACP